MVLCCVASAATYFYNLLADYIPLVCCCVCCRSLPPPQGVITNGPYAWMRHPAYLCKNLSWWMIAVPWSMHDGASMAFKRCVRLAMINLIYYARAMTEEAHLLRDQAYVDYYNALQRRYGLPARAVVSKQAASGEQQGQRGGAEEQQPLVIDDRGSREV